MVGISNDKKLGSCPLTWSAECQAAFEEEALTQAPILAYADFTQPFILYTDASHQGLGTVLAQVQDGKERIVVGVSTPLNVMMQTIAPLSWSFWL